ncbi:MAG: PQQ-like beta-propeller repeat protein [Ardenticatenaceae bacterium]|nr:PQQ-like beta-propeller repeat protein [Anaerolineales bacterium]MCB8923766.1 PQQ-like beta-propeller repeat protein [Ardenticatenaceae bacterium]MCB8990101.1 PQQ-like beta-propeller repeat protein [Ardenticatenaceae bacterium]
MMRKVNSMLLLFSTLTIIFFAANYSTSPALASSDTTLTTTNVFLPIINTPVEHDWPTVAGNPQRTSWTPEEVTGNVHLEWYRPIEAYIPQNTQIIASGGLLYVSTSNGLYALNASNGNLAWRFDTEMPLGNSPTVADGVVYVGGYDRKLHALNASNGQHLWSFDGAGAGYSANPLVVNGKVIVGNRDGSMYAIGAHDTAQQGQLIWKFTAGGAIYQTAAYNNGVVYFAAGDNHAYAVNANTGQLVWKSNQLPGLQFQSYWPVIFQDQVIFTTAYAYRDGLELGTRTIEHPDGWPYGRYLDMQLYGVWPEQVEGTLVGPVANSAAWAHGKTILNINRITEYLENNPASDPFKYKPWRRAFASLNMSNGIEYTFDSDNDGYAEYLPALWWGAGSGNRYPAIVGPDNILYLGNIYRCCSDEKGIVMGWNPDSPNLMSVVGGMGALAEPQAISMGGSMVYRNLCCDRVGDSFSIYSDGPTGTLWSYNLDDQAPSYDAMWNIIPGYPRLWGWYEGQANSINAAYHNHGDQNPIIPYQGQLFAHRSNAILAYGTGTVRGELPTIAINNVTPSSPTLTESDLISLLETEIGKMMDAGHLRPGFYNVNQFSLWKEFADYFDNPGDTLYVLSLAYPHVSSELQQEIRDYLNQEFQTYFDPNMYATIGWDTGAAREDVTLPPEIQADLSNYPPRVQSIRFSWPYPPFNFYAMWQYAATIPGVDVGRVYELAKSKLVVPVPSLVTNDYLLQKPFEMNAYIAGYTGFLELQTLAGMSGTDAALRTQVTNELNRLRNLRVTLWDKDSYWSVENFSYRKHLDLARNYIWLTPELGAYLNQQLPGQMVTAVTEYETIAPYWFVSRYEAAIGESVMSNLYNYSALFQAKALILGASQTELIKYLDVPAFQRGDLFYIQNLVTAIEAD